MCPKCRQHAQITETGKNTLKCQHCGALLQTRKLRVFHSSEDLEDAVLFRTRLQAEISGKGNETFSLTSLPKESQSETPKTESPAKEFKFPERSPSNPSPSPPKKDPKLAILEILKTADGKIEKEELQQKALEKGITQEKFKKILKTLLETGELYSPQSGIIKIV
ncbi:MULTISPECIES: DUF5817 domain-containing protein [unclassified Methanosarcina]|uniref:DUF5817 domain-containing protein n=1 Tax=unclassified Methanosarcina TaxID=2644672 RepID=UPI0025D474D1|nr:MULTISPECIES: hypothetical protein [unclassified Methanosarcina]